MLFRAYRTCLLFLSLAAQLPAVVPQLLQNFDSLSSYEPNDGASVSLGFLLAAYVLTYSRDPHSDAMRMVTDEEQFQVFDSYLQGASVGAHDHHIIDYQCQ